jgi:ectoine hydroxylase-related dioxygenase (phytanoyl-CoA dioxygenase family)
MTVKPAVPLHPAPYTPHPSDCAGLTDAEKAHLDEYGFVLLESVITADKADELRDLSLRLAEQDRASGHAFLYLGAAQRVWNLVNKGREFERVIQHPRVLAAMEHLLGADCTLSSFTVNVIGPNAPIGGMHIDYPLTSLPTPRPAWPLVANSVWYLDDFTVENGATCCVPGSHRRLEATPDLHTLPPDAVQAPGPKGSVLIVNGAAWHGSMPNTTDRDRVALLGFFCRAFMKPQQDHLKLVSPEVFARATPTLLRLLGADSQPNTLT